MRPHQVMQFLRLGDFGLELLYFTRVKLVPRKKNTSGINHWTLLVKDKFRFCRNLKQKGVKFAEESSKRLWGEYKAVFIAMKMNST